MSLATTLQATAARAMKQNGTPITIVRNTPGVYDPATGTTGAGVRLESPTYAVVTPASGGTIQAFDIRFQNGTLIETNLRALQVAASGLAFSPKPGDVVEGLEGQTWTILGVTPEGVMGQAVLYKMTVSL